MAWETFAYVIGVIVSLFVLLSSRNIVTCKRWNGLAFWQGLALFAWGIGHLLALGDQPLYRWFGQVLIYLCSLFILLAFRAYPLPPHLSYPNWKTALDVLTLTVINASALLRQPMEAGGAAASWLYHALGNGFLALSLFAVSAANRRRSWAKPFPWPFLGLMTFLLADATAGLLPPPLWLGLMLAAFVMIAMDRRRLGGGEERLDVHEEYLYFYDKLIFHQYDEKLIGRFLLFAVLCLFGFHHLTHSYHLGMAAVILLLIVRWSVTSLDNRRILDELFTHSRGLKQHLEVYMREIRSKNEELSRLLALNRSYERLLTKSNQQNMQAVSYENVHQMIEEIVDEWYATVPQYAYLRVSLQSAGGDVYYQVNRGKRSVATDSRAVSVQVVADEERDTPLSPRYVVVEAVNPSAEAFDDGVSFLHLLAVHVRGLLQRCLQHQQAMELRLVAQEMELASKIQFSLIPRERLALPGITAKAVYIPAAYVGGDYVDFVALDERYVCFLVADISGHGIPASLLTTGLRSSLRAVIQTCVSPDEILARLNRLLYDDLSQTRSFVTMFVAVFDREERVLLSSRAGHPQPLYLSARRQVILPCKGGAGLGLTPDAVYPLNRWKVEEDFLLLIYTDGLLQLGRTEGGAGVLPWLDAFRRAIETGGGPDRDAIEAIERCIWQRKQALQQDDDVSVLILDVRAR